jgi:Flp pilus assembly pilin Flp
MSKFFHQEEGSVITEYGLLIVIVAIALIAVLISFRGAVIKQFNNITKQITNAK